MRDLISEQHHGKRSVAEWGMLGKPLVAGFRGTASQGEERPMCKEAQPRFCGANPVALRLSISMV